MKNDIITIEKYMFLLILKTTVLENITDQIIIVKQQTSLFENTVTGLKSFLSRIRRGDPIDKP